MSTPEVASVDRINVLESEKGQFFPACCKFAVCSPKRIQRVEEALRDVGQRDISRVPERNSWRASFQATSPPRRAIARTFGMGSGLPGGCVTLGDWKTTRSHHGMIPRKWQGSRRSHLVKKNSRRKSNKNFERLVDSPFVELALIDIHFSVYHNGSRIARRRTAEAGVRHSLGSRFSSDSINSATPALESETSPSNSCWIIPRLSRPPSPTNMAMAGNSPPWRG